MKTILMFALGLTASAVLADVPQVKLADEIADGRPAVRWRGFNLLEMFIKGSNKKPKEFREEDFQIIRDWGFNFVRLPMDYRYWIKDGDWESFDEEHLQYVDRAIALGRKYNVHVLINMHRCPGYTVARPPEKTDLFTDPETQRVCARHWAMFARRYKGIPNSALSFNLFNEPPATTDEKYGHVAKLLVEAIHREDPSRFVIADGLAFGRNPVPSLYSVPHVGQATRGYTPMSVSHYLAPWVGTPSATPVWPISTTAPSGVMSGPAKKDLGMFVPFTLENVPAGRLTVEYGRISGSVTLEFLADGKTVKSVSLAPALNNPLWASAKAYPQWNNVVQADYLGEDAFAFRQPVKTFAVRVTKGDWVTFHAIRLESADGKDSARLAFAGDWGKPANFTQRFVGWGDLPFRSADATPEPPRYADAGQEYLYRKVFAQWEEPIRNGTFVFCGEFGVWKMTPHKIVLDIFEDYLRLWKERNMGWALWNLRGTNGVLDSERQDVDYEDFRGHKLDRKMLDLLRRY